MSQTMQQLKYGISLARLDDMLQGNYHFLRGNIFQSRLNGGVDAVILKYPQLNSPFFVDVHLGQIHPDTVQRMRDLPDMTMIYQPEQGDLCDSLHVSVPVRVGKRYVSLPSEIAREMGLLAYIPNQSNRYNPDQYIYDVVRSLDSFEHAFELVKQARETFQRRLALEKQSRQVQ
jgi:hypothetical protein